MVSLILKNLGTKYQDATKVVDVKMLHRNHPHCNTLKENSSIGKLEVELHQVNSTKKQLIRVSVSLTKQQNKLT
jgi:hypothetical protein